MINLHSDFLFAALGYRYEFAIERTNVSRTITAEVNLLVIFIDSVNYLDLIISLDLYALCN